MRRTIIGGVFVLIGTMISIAVFIAAAIYAPSITVWQGSKFWFAIFGVNDFGKEVVVDSLFLGFPFIIGIILFILGLIVLGMEYFRKEE
ncbi:hypothetical protein PAECIP111891_07058 [Paenibacillus allorhizoplanae]|uniref:Phosphatase n=1 Tax=Paenibacillus allorhizoplanae TaxID=2905648 RepID=A0ABM9CZC1_9BACL|nr:hypothetical protein [Paenibacillus allorhizoplanae]CAH1232614.1 hypothetical protein PAECIP111891_07058 [Paenibacillus allorhizoplanae]